MDCPRTPPERLQRFEPRFCPRRSCREHRRTRPGYRFTRHAYYTDRRGRRTPRFRCASCGSTFARRAFSVRYYAKRPELILPIARGLIAGSAHRQIARSLGCAPSTVTRLAARLGRHSLLLLLAALEQSRERLNEPVVIDHFETFEFSQDLPFGVATAVGSRSWFVYALEPAPHRRTGRISPFQRERLAQRPPRETRGGYEGSLRRLLERLRPLAGDGQTLRLVADAHPAYEPALRNDPKSREIRLSQFPNPERGPKAAPRSPAAIRRDRAMLPVDALHRLLRHSQAAHRRETIAFGRRLNALMERMFLFAVWRNFIKGLSEKKPDPTTPAMRLGLAAERWSWQRVLSRRQFPDRVRLGGTWEELYRREWTTPVLASNTRHALRLAY
jgi:transposase-like protein